MLNRWTGVDSQVCRCLMIRFSKQLKAISVAVNLFFPLALWSFSNGAPNGVTGGQFPGEGLCTRCHQGSEPNAGSGLIEMFINSTPVVNSVYTPGETVSILIRFNDPNAAWSGFQLTARSGDGCQQAGAFKTVESEVLPDVRIKQGACNKSGPEVQWVTHRLAKTGTVTEWEFQWTAPSKDAPLVTFALAANGANGNRHPTGDSIYNFQTAIAHFGGYGGPPRLTGLGIILADQFSRNRNTPPNALATAFGQEFARPGAHVSAQLDMTEEVPTMLAGTCLEVNRRRAPLLYVSSGQIKFQVPSETEIGQSILRIIRDCDTPDEVRGSFVLLNIPRAQPVLFMYTNNPPVVAAVHEDWSMVGPRSLFPGFQTTPATPGETIVVYGTGFGTVTPPLASGKSAFEERPLSSSDVRVLLGNLEMQSEDVVYAGISQGYPGLYELRIRIPGNTPSGLHSLVLMVDGISSAQGPFVAVEVPSP